MRSFLKGHQNYKKSNSKCPENFTLRSCSYDAPHLKGVIGGIFEILVDLEYGSIFDVLSRLSKIWPFHSDIAKDTLQILYHSM